MVEETKGSSSMTASRSTTRVKVVEHELDNVSKQATIRPESDTILIVKAAEQKVTEDRIKNIEQLNQLNLFSFVFCQICREVILPSRKPVICNMCKNAVVCTPCGEQWQKMGKGCMYCRGKVGYKQTQYVSVLDYPQVAKVFDVAKLECKNAPICSQVHRLSEVEEHERDFCEHGPCQQCNKFINRDTITMQSHQEIHCESSLRPCYFCKQDFTKKALIESHKCKQVIQNFNIRPSMVVNPNIIPQEFKADTVCYNCRNYLWNAKKCKTCTQSYCEACMITQESKVGIEKADSVCPKNDCDALIRNFSQISSISLELLEKLEVRCQKCEQNIKYIQLQEHLISHHFCDFCAKKLPTWKDIRPHYYQSCTGFIIECKKCEFSFTRDKYQDHDCLTHYSQRQLELVCLAGIMILQAICLGTWKSFSPSECNLGGGLRNFIASSIPNILITFFALFMMVNYRSIQSDHKLVRSVQIPFESSGLSQKITQERIYLGLSGTCLTFVILNNIVMKYNNDTWCMTDNLAYANTQLGLSDTFMSSEHYFFTLINWFCYLVIFSLITLLGVLYRERTIKLTKQKLA